MYVLVELLKKFRVALDQCTDIGSFRPFLGMSTHTGRRSGAEVPIRDPEKVISDDFLSTVNRRPSRNVLVGTSYMYRTDRTLRTVRVPTVQYSCTVHFLRASYLQSRLSYRPFPGPVCVGLQIYMYPLSNNLYNAFFSMRGNPVGATIHSTIVKSAKAGPGVQRVGV